MATSPSLPAGWYPDQQDIQLLRYWDGRQWTEHTHPPPPERPVAPPPPPPQPGPPSRAYATSPLSPMQRVPWWQTWWAIVPALLFCFPVGLVFLWMRQGVSLQVKSVVSVIVAATVIAVAVSDDSDDVPADAAEHPPAAAPEPSPSDDAVEDKAEEPVVETPDAGDGPRRR